MQFCLHFCGIIFANKFHLIRCDKLIVEEHGLDFKCGNNTSKALLGKRFGAVYRE